MLHQITISEDDGHIMGAFIGECSCGWKKALSLSPRMLGRANLWQVLKERIENSHALDTQES